MREKIQRLKLLEKELTRISKGCDGQGYRKIATSWSHCLIMSFAKENTELPIADFAVPKWNGRRVPLNGHWGKLPRTAALSPNPTNAARTTNRRKPRMAAVETGKNGPFPPFDRELLRCSAARRRRHSLYPRFQLHGGLTLFGKNDHSLRLRQWPDSGALELSNNSSFLVAFPPIKHPPMGVTHQKELCPAVPKLRVSGVERPI
ncbi:hypothetical protein [Aliiroseovarius subalbicans]|uniref:hypothetical protein n=1 Tax=Aliiroseovarius subalbicans TaxID=2925840 RepID=UPI001F582472|nr:hypothetical protein [Aliiroseovarius subalbicans]MCI2398983.1 hypothetical protein [Aliiroseovarius subalbicans]